MRRDQLLGVVAGLSPCVIGMEACSGAHEWARRFQGHGHTVRLMAEFGVVLPLRSQTVRRQAAQAAEALPDLAHGAW